MSSIHGQCQVQVETEDGGGVGIPPSLNTTLGGLIQATTGQIYWLAPVLNTML